MVAGVDYISGSELRVYPLYFAPIALLAWRLGHPGAAAGSVASAIGWTVSNYLAGLRFSHPALWVLNALTQTASFATVGFLISKLRSSLERERGLSRTDPLTGMLNTRAFHEESARLLSASRRSRRPLSIAYLDLDHFKSVNDQLGHRAGDDLLRTVATVLRDCVRPTDIAARIGGDEFVVLFPESGPSEAAIALERLRGALERSLAVGPWPVTASVGGVTFLTPPASVDDLVQQGDARMYAAKSSGRNQVHHEILG